MKLDTNNEQSVSIFSEVWFLLRDNIRNYAMYVALAVIFLLFNITTGGSFLTARNLTNLVNQTGYVAVMAVGMTIVLIIQQIDLSVGYCAGFFGACAALLLMRELHPGITIPLVLLGGMLMGLCQGLIVSKLRVPAFVTTLAFLFIFRGLLSLATEATGTVPVTNELFNELSNGFLPPVFEISGKHGLTLVISAVTIFVVIFSQIQARKDMKRYKFKVVSLPIFIFKLVFFSAIIGWLSYVLAGYNGISWTILIVIGVTMLYHFVLSVP